MRILLVEDDKSILNSLSFALENEHFIVERAENIRSASEKIEQQAFDFYIFDLGLPDGSGFSLCKQVRDQGNKPMLILSAYDEESNVVLGLELGADDYIVKPFRVKELIGRIRSILRRYEGSVQHHFRLKTLDIDMDRARVYKSGVELNLSVTEYKLLLMLAKHNQQTLTRAQIIDALWEGDTQYINDNTLSVNIMRLREKIEDTPNQPKYIVTIRGLGYSINL